MEKIIHTTNQTSNQIDDEEDDALYLNQIAKLESSLIETKTPSKHTIPASPGNETLAKTLSENEDDDDLINSVLDENETKQSSSSLLNIKTETELEDKEDESLEENKKYVNVLKKYFGHSSFRPMQLNIIKNVIEKKIDQLICMATGKGKSLCYQLPSVCVERGIVVVVSPLISLMEDQVMALKLVNIEACLMGSAQDQRDETNEKIFNGKCKILYLTPEFLQENVSFLEKINDTIGRLKFYL